MAHFYFITVIVIFLIVFIDIATPLKCFVCSSINSAEKCEDFYNKTAHTADICNLANVVCLKQILPKVGKSPVSTHRGCVDPDYCNLFKGMSHHCSTCNVDFCNSSIKIGAPSIVSTIFIYGFYILYQRFLR